MKAPRLIATIEREDILEEQDGRVHYMAKAAIDADGAGGNIWRDPDFQPETSLKLPSGKSLNANQVPFIVVPPAIIRGVQDIVLGCAARVTYKGKTITAVVGDIGPKAKLGELSVCAAKLLGIPCSPIHGGITPHHVFYEIWPGVSTEFDGVAYALQAA
jgi:hypothetical protein